MQSSRSCSAALSRRCVSALRLEERELQVPPPRSFWSSVGPRRVRRTLRVITEQPTGAGAQLVPGHHGEGGVRRECPLRKYHQERADTDAEPLYPRFDKFALLSGEKLRHRGRSREEQREEQRGAGVFGGRKREREEGGEQLVPTHHPPRPGWDVVAQLPFDGSFRAFPRHHAVREPHLRARSPDMRHLTEKTFALACWATCSRSTWNHGKKSALTMNQSPADPVARWAAVICCEENTPPTHTHTHPTHTNSLHRHTHSLHIHAHTLYTHTTHTHSHARAFERRNDEPFYASSRASGRFSLSSSSGLIRASSSSSGAEEEEASWTLQTSSSWSL